MKIHEFLGLDVGMVRTGIARANSAAGLAEPLVIVKTDEIFNKLKEIFRRGDVAAIIVGLPRSLDGNDTDQTRWVRNWVNSAKQQIEVPFYWQDEALTSDIAQIQKNTGSKHATDTLAAAVILQDWLDTPEAQRVAC